MSIENPRTNTNVNDSRGEHVPSDQQVDPRLYGGDHQVPQPRGYEEVVPDREASSNDTYTLPPQEQHDDTDPGFFKRHGGKLAVGVAAAVATGVALFGMNQGDRDAAQATNPPGTSAEPTPGTERPSSPAEQPATSEVNVNAEISTGASVAINGEVLKTDEAKADLFTISLEEAPTIEAAVDAYAKALADGMNLNVERNVVVQQGGAEAVSELNFQLLNGETGILTNLGDGHDKVLKIPTDYTEPSELVWEVSTKNATEETTSEVYVLNRQVNQIAPESYKVRGDLLVTSKSQSDGQAIDTDEYKLDMVAHQDPTAGTWVFGKAPYNTHIMR